MSIKSRAMAANILCNNKLKQFKMSIFKHHQKISWLSGLSRIILQILTNLSYSLQSVFTCDNIYAKHLQLFLDHQVLPYRNVHELELGKIDPKLLRKIQIKNLILCLNLLRFVLLTILSSKDDIIRPYLCAYFASSKNGFLFHFVTASTFLTPTCLCKSIFIDILYCRCF